VLQCVCSVLQYVAACCCVVLCVADRWVRATHKLQRGVICWQCVAVCCRESDMQVSLWQCVAVCCSVVQCDPVRCRQMGERSHKLQWSAVCCQCVAVFCRERWERAHISCSVLQCVVSVLQCVAGRVTYKSNYGSVLSVCCSVLQCDPVR